MATEDSKVEDKVSEIPEKEGKVDANETCVSTCFDLLVRSCDEVAKYP